MKIKYILASIILSAPSIVFGATLSVSPATQTVTVNDFFNVNIGIDTQNAFIDGVDVFYLNYNPALLQVQDASTSIAGIQISQGILMPTTLANSVDSTLGKITFSQVTASDSRYQGSGTLAVVRFKALTAGTANVTFNYTQGSTVDSNVASGGVDVLSSVINGTFTINNVVIPPAGGGGGGGGGGSSGGGGTTYIPPVATTTRTATSTTYIIPSNCPANLTCTPTAVSDTSTTYNFTSWLILGVRSSQVKNLQKVLNENGYTVSTSGAGSLGNETDYFGPGTQVALRRFQCAKLSVCSGAPYSTGYGATGPLTRRALSLLISSSAPTFIPTSVANNSQPSITNSNFTRSLTVGARGNDVKALQVYLNSKGFTVSTTGAGSPGNETSYFGPATRSALSRFQSANNISPPAGFFGPITREFIK